MKPKKLVFKNGRRVLIGYDEPNKKDSYQIYNRARNASSHDYVSFYHSTAWKHVRQQALNRDYYLCQSCGMEAQMVDHIVPTKDNWSERLNIDNLQSLCNHCHYLKTKAETKRRKELNEKNN